MRGVDDAAKRAALLKALRGGASVAEAAKASGYERSYVYRKARVDQELADVLAERGVGRRREKGQAPATAPAALGPSAPSDDPDVRLALETLRQVAQSGGKEDSPRVAAAKALLAYGEAKAAAARAAKAAEKQGSGRPVPEEPAAGDAGPEPINLERARAAVLGL